MEKRFDALIFDLDGVLIETVEAHRRAWEIVARHLGRSLDDATALRLRGRPREACLDILLEGRATSGPVECAKLLEWKDSLYKEQVARLGRKVRCVGAQNILWAARRESFKLAIASASRNAPLLLELAQFDGEFDHISDGAFAGPPKPSPSQLQSIARKLAVSAERCLLFEDSASGLEAASAAGMPAVAVALSGTQIACANIHNLAELATRLEKSGTLEGALAHLLGKAPK